MCKRPDVCTHVSLQTAYTLWYSVFKRNKDCELWVCCVLHVALAGNYNSLELEARLVGTGLRFYFNKLP